MAVLVYVLPIADRILANVPLGSRTPAPGCTESTCRTGQGTNEFAARRHFLWVDDEPDRARRVRNGEILIAPMNGSRRTKAPNALIHDWIVAACFPETTIEKLFAPWKNTPVTRSFTSQR
jgi:hypothetical protein